MEERADRIQATGNINEYWGTFFKVKAAGA
jgi:hypothetical protein